MPTPSNRYFTRRLTTRQFYRGDNGRFISQEEGIRRGVTPVTSRFYVFKDNRGRRRSREFVGRQRQRVVTLTQSGELLRRESPSVVRQVAEVVPSPSFQTIQSQRFRAILNDAVSRNKTIGVQFNDELYVLDDSQVGDLERFFTEIEYEYIRLFQTLLGGSLVLQLLHADGESGEVFDFDSLTTAPADFDDDELNEANAEFRRGVSASWRRYFG